jgi:hypothetical protein
MSQSPAGEKNVTVSNTAGAYLGAHHLEPNKPNGTIKSKERGSGIASVPAASPEATPRPMSPGTSGNVFGPLSVTTNGVTFNNA